MQKRINVLLIVFALRETSTQYNELTLPMLGKHNVIICSFRNSEIKIVDEVKLYEGNSSIKTFIKVLMKTIKDNKIDIIHCHSPHVGFMFLICKLLSLKKLPPHVITVHSSFPNFNMRNKMMYIPVFLFFRKIIFCGKESHNSFPPFYKIISGNRAVIIQNGVNIERIDSIINREAKKSDYDKENVIISVGRLVKVKNHAALLHAYKEIKKKCKLEIVGDGELKDEIVSESRKLGILKKINLKGTIPREDVFKCLSNANLFVSTSRIEGLPVAVLEAMACRCPVILSDIPSHREVVEGLDCVPLVKVDDIRGYAQAIDSFFALPEQERKKIGDRCRAHVEENFSLDKMLREYEDLYYSLI